MTPAAYAVLDAEALQHNLQKVRECAPASKIMAVIKANAYGHGMVRVAEALRAADAFAVARVDEGIKLRKAGIPQRIAVLQGFSCQEELQELLRFELETVIHCREQLEILEQYVAPGILPERLRRNRLGDLETLIRYSDAGILTVWLKLDTGMNRLGFQVAEFTEVYRRLALCLNVRQPVNLMTHFADADDLDSGKTMQQIVSFKETTRDYPGERSIANSAGILAWQESLADWVRPGVMLYGISPFADKCGRDYGLKPLMSLHSRLIAVKPVAQGAAVGYGGNWVCPKPTLLGVAAIGYGDGYPRHAPNGTPVLVNGRRAALVGRVSMDMISVDLENCPEAEIGDPVTLWGDGLPVEEVARHAGTIPYTLVCGITQRVNLVEERNAEMTAKSARKMISKNA
ncbi:MAG: alanine racemase [Gammaproteobacteria bacterium]